MWTSSSTIKNSRAAETRGAPRPLTAPATFNDGIPPPAELSRDELAGAYQTAMRTEATRVVDEWIDVKGLGGMAEGIGLVVGYLHKKKFEVLFEDGVVRDCILRCKNSKTNAQPFTMLLEAPAWALRFERVRAWGERSKEADAKVKRCGGAASQLEVVLFAVRNLDGKDIKDQDLCPKVYCKLVNGGKQCTVAKMRTRQKGNRGCLVETGRKKGRPRGVPSYAVLGDATDDSELVLTVKHVPKTSLGANDNNKTRALAVLRVPVNSLQPNEDMIGWLPMAPIGEVQLRLHWCTNTDKVVAPPAPQEEVIAPPPGPPPASTRSSRDSGAPDTKFKMPPPPPVGAKRSSFTMPPPPPPIQETPPPPKMPPPPLPKAKFKPPPPTSPKPKPPQFKPPPPTSPKPKPPPPAPAQQRMPAPNFLSAISHGVTLKAAPAPLPPPPSGNDLMSALAARLAQNRNSVVDDEDDDFSDDDDDDDVFED